jgi:hypothetical protein
MKQAAGRFGFFLGIFFQTKYGRCVPPKRRSTYTELRAVISQKIKFFKENLSPKGCTPLILDPLPSTSTR